MSLVLSITLFLLLPSSAAQNTSAGSYHNIYEFCRPTRCSPDGPDVRYPFRLRTQPIFCGLEGFELSCSNKTTLLHLPSSSNYYVQHIDYLGSRLYIMDVQETECTLQSLFSPNLKNSVFFYNYLYSVRIFNCTERIPSLNTYYSVLGPIGCISYDRNFVYAIKDFYSSNDTLPSICSGYRTVETSIYGDEFETTTGAFSTPEIRIEWKDFGKCFDCESSGKYCGFNTTSNSTICCKYENLILDCTKIHYELGCENPRNYCGSSNSTSCCIDQSPTLWLHFQNAESTAPIAIIIESAASIGVIIFIVLATLIVYKSKKSDDERETQLKVDKFLEEYKTLNPTRYTYSDLKKITGRFKHRLGKGGYGSVFRGKFSNGIPVAVKILEHSKGDGEEFINEVATIGRIHHFNIVRLLGFCYEGTRRALIYEFMPNGSLEKFIFSKINNSAQRPLSWEKLWNIAIGVARGVEYLHQGCNQRILHFDIKPHNILLDHNFRPKISDFGLAKLCSKEQSIVSMTAARGTAGYIAPELFSRNFGDVSFKSDVFSYGMMLLEMVGCRKNIDLTVENQSQIYFPEWIYNKISQGNELNLEIEANGDEEIAKKLAIVGLWCIQWNPTERPSMPMVIQMLDGDLQRLEMPPKPFVSSNVEMGEN